MGIHIDSVNNARTRTANLKTKRSVIDTLNISQTFAKDSEMACFRSVHSVQ